MSAEVESMFYVRETPWHGLGTRVEGALSSREALIAAGLNWNVIQKEIYTKDGFPVKGYYANVRDSDQKVLGVVTGRYRIVQNREAFAFTDGLLGKGVSYETAGSLKEGRRTWILARLPKQYRLVEDKVVPYLVFSNSHDGSGSIKVAMTPVRVVCQNTLNFALSNASRVWCANHTGNMESKLEDARMTLFLAENYMNELLEVTENEQDKISSADLYTDYLNACGQKGFSAVSKSQFFTNLNSLYKLQKRKVRLPGKENPISCILGAKRKST